MMTWSHSRWSGQEYLYRCGPVALIGVGVVIWEPLDAFSLGNASQYASRTILLGRPMPPLSTLGFSLKLERSHDRFMDRHFVDRTCLNADDRSCRVIKFNLELERNWACSERNDICEWHREECPLL